LDGERRFRDAMTQHWSGHWRQAAFGALIKNYEKGAATVSEATA
jgi:hypothetical protein